MASVNGYHSPPCEDPADGSNSHLLGPHGFEGQENDSLVGARGGWHSAWALEETSMYQNFIISTPAGTLDENGTSISLPPHRFPFKSLRKPQSLTTYIIVSSVIPHLALPYLQHFPLHCPRYKPTSVVFV